MFSAPVTIFGLAPARRGHLDLSRCDLAAGHCRILSEGLEANQSLLGLHVSGNEAQVDGEGFLVPRLPQVGRLGARPQRFKAREAFLAAVPGRLDVFGARAVKTVMSGFWRLENEPRGRPRVLFARI